MVVFHAIYGIRYVLASKVFTTLSEGITGHALKIKGDKQQQRLFVYLFLYQMLCYQVGGAVLTRVYTVLLQLLAKRALSQSKLYKRSIPSQLQH